VLLQIHTVLTIKIITVQNI